MGLFHFHKWTDWEVVKAVEFRFVFVEIEFWQQRSCTTCNYVQMKRSSA